MGAPDKIYLAFDHGFVAQSSTSKEDVNGNSIFLSEYKPIEYIRKDALLEWIEEYQNTLSEFLKNKHSPVTAGKMYVLIKLLDKLNSM